jgi:N-acetylneuraminic acid mutarotase
MVVWGGSGDFEADPLTDGAALDAATRTWRKIPAAPISPRFDARAFWTGSEMVVFGGTSVDGDVLADGASWNPASNAWRPLPASPLGVRDGSVVAWAGDRLVVWGGATVVPPPDAPDDEPSGDAPEPPEGAGMRNDGAAYVPASDSWVPVAAAPIPPRSGAESVWTGTRLVISGGYSEGDDSDRSDGAALDPVTGAWSAIAARPSPGSCGGSVPCAGVWTGSMALFPGAGLAYHPSGDRWSPLAPYPAAEGLVTGEATVWAGERLLVWGTASDAAGDEVAEDGDDGSGEPSKPPPTAFAYDPATNGWQAFPVGPLSGRLFHTAVWTGQDMLVWGGTADDSGLADGAAYRPAP